MNKLLFVLAVLTLSLGAYPNVGWAQCDVQSTRIVPSDITIDDEFGQSAAVSGDVAVVGTGRDSAYIYRLTGATWLQGRKLTPSDTPGSGTSFGSAVAIDGDTVVVGAYREDAIGSLSGSAYVYRYDGTDWNQEAKLLSVETAAGHGFGVSVAVSGNVVVVGAYNAGNSFGFGNGHGAAYSFRFNGVTWEEESKLLSLDVATGDEFGGAVAVFEDVAVVGASHDGDNGVVSGSAYMFRFSGGTWVQEQKLLPLGGAPRDRFGHSVALSGDTVVVGASGNDDMGSGFGSAYVYGFDGTTWVVNAQLGGSGSVDNGQFGYSVAVSGDMVVVGAFGEPTGMGPGRAYAFRHDGSAWIEAALLLSDEGALFDGFGYSAAVSDDVAVVGARGEDVSGSNAGAVYMSDLRCAPVECTNDVDCDDGEACTVDTCVDGVCVHDGSGCVCEECVTLDADGDGDVDLADYAAFACCIEGPG